MRNLEIPWSSRWITPDSEFDLRETSSLVRSESESESESEKDADANDDTAAKRKRRDTSFLLIAIVDRPHLKVCLSPGKKEKASVLAGEEGLRTLDFSVSLVLHGGRFSLASISTWPILIRR